MGEKLTVCLIGPAKGGKSSMLATLTDCVSQRVHGYPPDLLPTIQPITQAEFDDASEANARLRVLGMQGGGYHDLRQEFAEGVSATDVEDTFEYFFRLELNGAHPGIAAERLPIVLQVVDAAGEIAFPQGATQVADEVKNKFDSQILNAEALVFVVPLVNLEEAEWIHQLSQLIEKLSRNSRKRVKRIIVAFAQYERLFVRFGPSAFTYACDPRVALHVVRGALKAAPWLDQLRTLERGNGAVSVRFTVTSAYGFVKKYHNPNIDPHEKGQEDKRFRRPGVPTNRSLNEFWRPFLTAEPILYAALGVDSAFTFSYRQVDSVALAPGEQSKSRPGQPRPGPEKPPTKSSNSNGSRPRKPGFFSRIRDALNVNRRP